MRLVRLPEDVAGRLYFSAMPGRYRPFSTEEREISERVDYVVSLTALDEIHAKSPDYACAIENDALMWDRLEFGISDYGVPSRADRRQFMDVIRRVAGDLRRGSRVLIHCGAGIGRTGTVAACVLIALGLSKKDALLRVEEAGSRPETEAQYAFIAEIAIELDEPA